MGFKTYEDAVEMIEQVGKLAKQVESEDRDLAKQLRKCGSSVVLNLAEGRHRRGGHRRERF